MHNIYLFQKFVLDHIVFDHIVILKLFLKSSGQAAISSKYKLPFLLHIYDLKMLL